MRTRRGVGVEQLRSIYEDDPDMVEIVREFAEQLPERAAALRQRHASGELEELKVLAHQLKGAGGGYGYPAITDRAGALEEALRDAAAGAVITDRLEALCRLLESVKGPEPS